MKVKNYYILLIIILLLFLFSSCNPLLNRPKPIAPFVDNTNNATIIAYFTSPSKDIGLENVLVNFMDTAQSTIDMAIYGLNEEKDQIVDELIKKKEQGVNVRVVTDGDSLDNYKDDFSKLENAKIEVVSDLSGVDSKYIMHDKFVVVDNKKVWTGSTNFTDNGFIYNYNNSLTIVSTKVAFLYDKEFTQMFVNKKFKTSKTPFQGVFYINGTKIEIYFGPKDRLMDKVIQEVKTADKSLYFDIFTFTYKSLADEIISKKSISKGVFDEWQSESEYSQYDYLKENWVDVRKDGIYGLLHNKVMIIDENTDSDPMVITGSANWTNSVENYNDENMIIIHSDKFSKLYYDNFLKIYNGGVN